LRRSFSLTSPNRSTTLENRENSLPKFTFVVFSEPASGRESEFNRWYNDQHLPDVLNVPGFAAAQRFKLFGATGNPSSAATCLALYQLDTEDPEIALAELKKRTGTYRMVLSENHVRGSHRQGDSPDRMTAALKAQSHGAADAKAPRRRAANPNSPMREYAMPWSNERDLRAGFWLCEGGPDGYIPDPVDQDSKQRVAAKCADHLSWSDIRGATH